MSYWATSPKAPRKGFSTAATGINRKNIGPSQGGADIYIHVFLWILFEGEGGSLVHLVGAEMFCLFRTAAFVIAVSDLDQAVLTSVEEAAEQMFQMIAHLLRVRFQVGI